MLDFDYHCEGAPDPAIVRIQRWIETHKTGGVYCVCFHVFNPEWMQWAFHAQHEIIEICRAKKFNGKATILEWWDHSKGKHGKSNPVS